VRNAKNPTNPGFKQTQISDSFPAGFNGLGLEVRNFQSFQSSNFKRVQVNNRFYVRCLRPGHWRHSCHNSVICNKCQRPGHFASNCRPANLGQVGFTAKHVITDCFGGGTYLKESIRISRGGSRERNKLGRNNRPPYFFPSLTSHISYNALLLAATPPLLRRLS
jgi:hypothetical protein